jgi:hypothetical protein
MSKRKEAARLLKGPEGQGVGSLVRAPASALRPRVSAGHEPRGPTLRPDRPCSRDHGLRLSGSLHRLCTEISAKIGRAEGQTSGPGSPLTRGQAVRKCVSFRSGRCYTGSIHSALACPRPCRTGHVRGKPDVVRASRATLNDLRSSVSFPSGRQKKCRQPWKPRSVSSWRGILRWRLAVKNSTCCRVAGWSVFVSSPGEKPPPSGLHGPEPIELE